MALFAKESAARGHFLSLGIDRHMQPFVEICFFVRFDFFNQQTERSRQGAHVDLIHLFAAGQFQKTLEHRTADGIAGHFGGPGPIGDDQALVAFRRQLREQASKLFAEVQIRFDQRVGLGVEVRDTLGGAGDAEVAHLHLAVGGHEHVGRLETSVNHALGVGVSQSQRHLGTDLGHARGRQARLAPTRAWVSQINCGPSLTVLDWLRLFQN